MFRIFSVQFLQKEIQLKKILFSYLKILIYTVLCYLLLFSVEIICIVISEIINASGLSSILIKQSAFLISGFIIILISRCNKIYSPLNIVVTKTIAFYFLTILIIFIFFYILFVSGIFDFKVYNLEDRYSFFKLLIYCIIPTFFIGFGEEIIFRWFLLNRLKTLLNANTAIVISSLIFSLGHNWNIPNMLFSITSGCLFALIYTKTNSIFYCISIHSAWNFGQRFFLTGMSEFTFDAQRFVLFDVKNIKLYNWMEFVFSLIIISLFLFFNSRKKSIELYKNSPGIK